MEIIKYNEIEVKIDYENNTIWLTQEEIAKLYKIDRSAIQRGETRLRSEGVL